MSGQIVRRVAACINYVLLRSVHSFSHDIERETTVNRTLFGLILAGSVLAMQQGPALAEAPTTALIDRAFIEDIRAWVAAPTVHLILRAQNDRNRELGEERILALDAQWRAETKAAEQPIIAQLMGNPLSQYLLQIQARSLGLYSEIFIMDAKGLNVGQSSVTTDYWQGDEAKWQKTFAVGPDAVFVDKVEFDDETRTHRAQVNLTIVDPETRQSSGAITVEVNLDELRRRRAGPLS